MFTATLEEVLSQVKDLEILPVPQPIRKPLIELDQARYCRYHRSVGHDTDEYRDLIREFVKLIERGNLKRFVRREPGKERVDNQPQLLED